MRTFNRTYLIGFVGAKPEKHETQNGNELSTFPVATNFYTKDKNNETRQETDFHRIVCWGSLSKFVQEHLNKGSLVFLEGRITNRSYEDNKTKQTCYRTEIVCSELKILSWKNKEENSNLVEAVNSQENNENISYNPNL